MRNSKRYVREDRREETPKQPKIVTVKAITVTPIELKTPNQEKYIDAIYDKDIIVASGCAGTGKTFLAVHAACELLRDKEIDSIILTKPIVEVGKSMGALPGNVDEKMAPFILSVEQCFTQIIGKAKYHELLTAKKIQIVALNFIRGLTLSNCAVIADEMQNSTYEQMKALLTRIGEGAVFIINGDLHQKDLQGDSGLAVAIKVLKSVGSTEHIEFGVDDIVRSGILKEIIISYNNLETSGR